MEKKRIFDKFEHIGVYVVDSESMTICYENELMRQYTGGTRLGEVCYRVYGNDNVCSSCPIPKKDHRSIIHRTDHEKVVVIYSEKVVWEGRDAYMIYGVRHEDYSAFSDNEKSMSRMSRALKKSINVYTEINMNTMEYRQINLRDADGFSVPLEGDYRLSFEHMCNQEIHPEDVAEVRRVMSPANLQRISAVSAGAQEIKVRYRLKNVVPERIMESRGIFMRDEVPHYFVSIATDVTEEVHLRQQANQLENILSHVSCGIEVYNVDSQGNVTSAYVSEELARMMDCEGETLKEAVNENPLYGIAPEHSQGYKNVIKRVVAGEKDVEYTFRVITAKGTEKWGHAKFTATNKENGVVQVFGTFVDVTADIKSQRIFKEKYEVERRRRIDDASLLAFGVFNLNSGKALEIERKYPLQEFLGNHNIKDFCIDISNNIVDADKRVSFLELFDRENAIQMHQKGIDERSIEYQRKLPNGDVIWVKSSFHILVDMSQDIMMLFYYCNNINSSKTLQLMTSYMVNKDYDILGSVNLLEDNAMIIYGKYSSRRKNNLNQLLPVQEKHIESLDWFINNAVVPEERALYQGKTIVADIIEKFKKEDYYELILHVQSDQGVRTKKIRYIKNKNNPNNCFFSQIDLTETLAAEEKKQQQLQEALDGARQANIAKTAFLSRMSHDMRTPMNGILGMASLCKDETDSNKLLENIGKIKESGEYLLNLINDTLDLQRIESGKLKLEPVTVIAQEAAVNIIELVSMGAQAKGVTLQYHKGDTDLNCYIHADILRIKQIFINLLSNAIKFTPVGGAVDVEFKLLGRTGMISHVLIYVRDTGVGMSQEYLEKGIFKPFSQENNELSSKYAGSGLGLSIAKSLVELMGGRIEVESELGVGTSFAVYLDIERVDAAKVAKALKNQKKQSQDITAQLVDRKILLAEDHPLNAEISIKLLEKVGCQVTWAKNGQEALETFAQAPDNSFDVILMDVRMPIMDGLEATSKIRALDKKTAQSIPIIAMTANAYEEDVKACLTAGMTAHMGKPISPAILYATVAQYLPHKD